MFNTLISILTFISGVFISMGVASYFQVPVSLDLPKPTDYAQKLKKPAKTTYLYYIVPFAPTLLQKAGWDVRIKRRLEAAHFKMVPVEFFNLKIMLMVIIIVLLSSLFKTRLAGLMLVGGTLGYLVPDILLNQKINKRKRLIVKQLPEAIDLIGLCIEAGLDFNSALRWVVEKLPRTPLIEEFSFMLEEIKWGKPRSQALKDMSRRLNLTEVNSLVLTLAQAERMGTPVAEAFSILSEDSRAQRFHRGERIALKAPIKILIPLIFCILPVIGIVVGAPILLEFMKGDFTEGIGESLSQKAE